MTEGFNREELLKLLEEFRRQSAALEAKHALIMLLLAIKPLMEEGPTLHAAKMAHEYGKADYERFANLLLRPQSK